MAEKPLANSQGQKKKHIKREREGGGGGTIETLLHQEVDRKTRTIDREDDPKKMEAKE